MYSQSIRRFRTMESAANRLQKEAKGYLDSLRGRRNGRGTMRQHEGSDIVRTAMTASQMRIAETIDAFYGDAGANDGVSRSYKQAVEDLDAETIKALDGPFRYTLLECQCDKVEGEELTLLSAQRQTVLEPITRFCAYFPDINECKSLFCQTRPNPSPSNHLPTPPSLLTDHPSTPTQASKNATTNSSTTTPPAPK